MKNVWLLGIFFVARSSQLTPLPASSNNNPKPIPPELHILIRAIEEARRNAS